MHVALRTKLAVAAATLAFPAGLLIGTAGTASAAEVQPAGGCEALICGTVNNDSSYNVEVCKNWTTAGDSDQSYSSHSCASSQTAFVKPHTTYGFPELVDLDALYTQADRTYHGYYTVAPSTTHHNMTWTHTKSGWWKFATNVTVYITSEAPPA